MPTQESNKSLVQVQRNLFFILVAFTTMAFMGMISSFLPTVLWAVVLTMIFHGLYRWIAIRFRGRRPALSASLTVILIFLFVIIPFIFLTIALVGQGQEIYQASQSGELDVNVVVNYVEDKAPEVAEYLSDYGISTDDIRERLSGLAVTLGQTIGNSALSIGGNVINLFIQFTLMLYLLFFFLKDGKKIVRAFVNTIPMGNIREKALFTRFAQVSKATLKGTAVVAIVQGSIGGILFTLVGIPAALLWAVAMTLLALLPVGGSAIIWLPAAVVLFAQGQVTEAVIVVIVGSLIIGLVDNLLRPLLVGRDTEMPDYLVLVSTLGGITYFGLSGFVIGPTIAALFITVWEMMGKDYGGKNS